jgi:hypothetical protein
MHVQVRLHLGAHKTATTHLQHVLLRNREVLAKARIHYIELYRLREILTAQISRLLSSAQGSGHPTDVGAIRAAIKEELATVGKKHEGCFNTLVVSDENIIGGLVFLARSGKLYENRLNRLKLVKRIFEECPIAVTFAIRNYNDFYPSAYAQLVKQGWTVSYSNFLQRLNFERNSWRAIFSDLSSVFGHDHIRLFKYEDYPGNIAHVLERIVGESLELQFDAAKIVYPSLNLKGIEVLLTIGSVLSRSERSRLGKYLADEFIFDQDYGMPVIDDSTLRGILERMYQEDQSELAPYLFGSMTGGKPSP